MAAPAYQEPVLKVVGSVQSYVDSSTDYIRLQVFKTLMRLMTSLVKSSVLGVLIILALLFLSIGATLALGAGIENYPLAFVLMGVFYLLAAGIAYTMRGRLEQWVLQSYSDLYWNEN
ncbi:hypothetical protein [Robiginitalea sp.]|uniref:hypothetical protein n=1 Tax=Robiginitalea sp. TaxID=1902411 RepID=UPI003C4F9CF5